MRSEGEVVKKNELVWRELVDASVSRGERRWDNLDDLAFRSGVATATAAYALRRLIEIGAVQQHHAGFTVVNPEKVLTSLCAARSVISDAHSMVTLHSEELDRILHSSAQHGFISGGAAAAVELLGGVNTVSDYSEHLYYLRDDHAAAAIDDMLIRMGVTRHTGYGRDRGNVTFLLADIRAARTWQDHTSFAQTYADLFALPRWQTSEFRLALHEKFFSKRDWDQE